MKWKLLLFLSILSLGAPPSEASLIFTLDAQVMAAAPGFDPLIFTGTLIDSDGDGSFLFLNDIAVTFTPADDNLSLDPTGQPASSPNTFFFDVVPGTLLGDNDPNDDIYAGPIFEVFVAASAPDRIYSGSISILGGYSDNSDASVLATQTFQVNVVPEPAAAGLTLAGLIGLAFARRRL